MDEKFAFLKKDAERTFSIGTNNEDDPNNKPPPKSLLFYVARYTMLTACLMYGSIGWAKITPQDISDYPFNSMFCFFVYGALTWVTAVIFSNLLPLPLGEILATGFLLYATMKTSTK